MANKRWKHISNFYYRMSCNFKFLQLEFLVKSIDQILKQCIISIIIKVRIQPNISIQWLKWVDLDFSIIMY